MKKYLHIVMVAAAGIAVLAWAGAFTPQAAGQAPAAAGVRAPAPKADSRRSRRSARSCHGNPNVDRAPTPAALREMTPEKIYDGADDGRDADAGVGAQRRPEEGASPSSWPAGRSAAPRRATPRTWASSAAPIRRSPIRRPGPSWNGWSPDLANTRFQPAQVARPDGRAGAAPEAQMGVRLSHPACRPTRSRPIASGRVFVGSDNGFVYSIDAKTGCVYWSFENGSIIRNALTVGAGHRRTAPRSTRVFFGDGHANVFALNAQDGKLLWKTKVDPHFVARITAGVRYYDGKLIVPVSSSEEFSSGNPGYPCCTSRGSVVALDANTGKADLEGLGRARRAEAVQDDGERRDALCAGRRRGVELADDRSGEARRLLRHRRRDDGAAGEDDGRDHGGRSRYRQAPVVVSGDRERRLHGRLQRRRTSARRARTRWAPTWTSATRRS